MTSTSLPVQDTLPRRLTLSASMAIVGSDWSLADALFLDELIGRRPPASSHHRFPVRADADAGAVAALGRLLTAFDGPRESKVLVEVDEAVLLLALDDGFADLAVAGERGASERTVERVRDLIGEALPPAGRVPVTFWWLDTAPRRRQRAIDVPVWPQIAGNYAAPVREAMTRLIEAGEPPEHGRLLLWHGPPGTGKSFALRALLDAWRGWCAPNFVIDPDKLFGRGAAYLAQLMVAGDPGYGRPWRLLILEDAGELMAADARSMAGQGLSRLLNLADGLLGQGARTLILITTNEPLGRLDPAVRRPGRCWAELEFPPLSAGEADAWAAAHGRSRSGSGPATLAELYAGGSEPASRRAPFGFAAA